VTLGADFAGVRELAARHQGGWTAADVVSGLTGESSPPQEGIDPGN